MEKSPISRSEKQENRAHQEAIEFVERHRDLFEHYARGTISIEPAPADLDTFAFDLQTNKIYINSRFYKEKGLSEQKTTFATLHELEHFLEKVAILKEDRGEAIFAKYLENIKKSRAFSLLDNCVADIRENRTVVAKTEERQRQLEKQLYQEDLFKETDFTTAPRHIQFAQAILREHRVPEEKTQVASEVRTKLDELEAVVSANGVSLIDAMTNPETPMSLRLKLQEQYLVPMMQELLEQDLEEEKQKKADQGKGGEGEGQPDPNEVFADDYAQAEEKTPHAVPIDELEKTFKKWQENKQQDPLERADQERADKFGVDKEDLQEYDRLSEEINNFVDPETGETSIEELRKLIRRIISERKTLKFVPAFPLEEGEELIEPAELIGQVKSGNLEPKVWQDVEFKEKQGKRFGEVEITLVADRSGSMQGKKLFEQRRAVVLFMEALKEFADLADEQQASLQEPLSIKSEIYSFQQDNFDSIPLKPLSKELSQKQRIEVAKKLTTAPGGTTDFVVLQAINSKIDEESKNKIKSGELKKIVIVFTDGESNDANQTKAILKDLKNKGVVVVGVGITEEGRPALTTYAPEARLAKKAQDLPKVLADLLKEHLQNL